MCNNSVHIYSFCVTPPCFSIWSDLTIPGDLEAHTYTLASRKYHPPQKILYAQTPSKTRDIVKMVPKIMGGGHANHYNQCFVDENKTKNIFIAGLKKNKGGLLECF